MDNIKIGNLISELRRKQGLTQQELGDKVGVGFRAVSKWERGVTLPDISIINDLSKVLGITSDELLAGKLNKENKSTNKKKLPKGIKITISIITTILLIVTSILIYTKNKIYVYDIYSTNEDEYIVKGQVTFQNKKISIIINKLYFTNRTLNSIIISNYEYDIKTGNKYLFGYGKDPNGNFFEKNMTIEECLNNFRINYDGKTDIRRKAILKNNILITLKFQDENNKEIIKELKLDLISKKQSKNVKKQVRLSG